MNITDTNSNGVRYNLYLKKVIRGINVVHQ
jgi:hypothetical protein